ncbi:MAG: DUF3943 domain-containing protein [Proteobacteria bacterium]|nr:MAG: DUF3943 domain-containing protein [Pseudomonadota bacterium]
MSPYALFALLLAILGLTTSPAALRAEEFAKAPVRIQDENYQHVTDSDISGVEKAGNFGFVYAAQWAVYYASQSETIKEHGGMENWTENPFKPHFDKDHFNYNLFKHTAVGQYYYLFYRSRGYDKKTAFAWTTLSSLAFEFTIETMTERPSYQDIYQTPVFGSIVGMGFEQLSLYFHSLETWPSTMLGYLFNPFTVLPFSHYKMGFYPARIDNKTAVAIRFGMDL